MTARRSLILILTAILALTMCSFSVFAMDKEELAATMEAPDAAVANESPDLAVSNDATDLVGLEAPDGAENPAVADGAEDGTEVPELDAAADGAEAAPEADGEGEVEEAEPEASEEEEEEAEEADKKTPFVKTAGFWILVVLGALILLFIILWIVKPSFREKVKKLIREYKSELKKIVWSPKADVIKNTKTVVAAIVVTAVVIGLIDLGLGKLIDLVGHIG